MVQSKHYNDSNVAIFLLTLIVALTTVLRTTVLHCDNVDRNTRTHRHICTLYCTCLIFKIA